MVTVKAVKTIAVDNDVYSSLLNNVADFGESPNSVLRRLLKIGPSSVNAQPSPKSGSLQELVGSTEFYYAKGVVGRFLAVLSWLYKADKGAFHVVEGIRGRGRIYFAKSSEELTKSGRSVNPKRIPDTPYWVITTTSTDLKLGILSDVMKALGYDLPTIQCAKQALPK